MNEESIRVLLIEDDPDDTLLIQEMLSEAKGARFEVECADRLADGLERLGESGIEVILLDLGLPDCTGRDSFLTTRRFAPVVPVIVLTGLDDEALALRLVREGAQAYLVKGQVNSDLLARAICSAVQRKRSEEELK